MALTTVGSAVLTAALCGLAPALIRWLPEPSPEGAAAQQTTVDAPALAAEDAATSRGGPTYRELAAAPRLGWWLAAVGAVVGAVVGWALRSTGAVLAWDYLGAVGVVLSYVDARTRLLPTRIIAPSFAVLVLLLTAAALVDGSTSALIGAGLGWVAMGGVYFLLWFVYPVGIGYGDVRLAGLLGLGLGYLGWHELVAGIYAGFVLGGFGGVVLLLLRQARDNRYAFGPFMVMGALAAACSGWLLDDWYVVL